MMRVITGSARGRRLETLPGEDVTRPTSESVKEALFSMIQFEIEGKKVLDLFAGSGQLGIEALSRGAGECVFVEMNKNARAPDLILFFWIRLIIKVWLPGSCLCWKAG